MKTLKDIIILVISIFLLYACTVILLKNSTDNSFQIEKKLEKKADLNILGIDKEEISVDTIK